MSRATVDWVSNVKPADVRGGYVVWRQAVHGQVGRVFAEQVSRSP